MATDRFNEVHEGMTLYDRDGSKIGSISEVGGTGSRTHGQFLRASTGLFGLGQEIYAPFDVVERIESDGVYLRVTKDEIGNLGWSAPPAIVEAGGSEQPGSADASAVDRRTEHSPERRQVMDEGDQSFEMRQEELVARKERVEAGEVEIRTEVVSEQKTIDVPVSREEVVLERRPVEGRAATGSIGDDQRTIDVPVYEERINVDKESVVTEEISVGTREVQETRRVSDTVRKEVLDVEAEGDVVVRGWDDVKHRFRQQFDERNTSQNPPRRWEDVEPSYRYGWETANQPTNRSRSWRDAESDLEQDWRRDNREPTWENASRDVRETWDSAAAETRSGSQSRQR